MVEVKIIELSEMTQIGIQQSKSVIMMKKILRCILRFSTSLTGSGGSWLFFEAVLPQSKNCANFAEVAKVDDL